MALLSGYRMLDLSRLMAAPYAAHLLADMGMDVIKVEEPEPRYGMPRDSFTPYLPTPEGERRASAFNPLGRNKRSIALDLLRPELRPRSQEVFYRLAERADVVIEGYRPGVLAWMGIDCLHLRSHTSTRTCELTTHMLKATVRVVFQRCHALYKQLQCIHITCIADT